MVDDDELSKMDAQAAYARVEELRETVSELRHNPVVSEQAAEDALVDADDALARAQVDIERALENP